MPQSSPPILIQVDDVIEWMDDAGSWSYLSVYWVLDDQAPSEFWLVDNWDYAKVENGVDH